MFSFVMIIIYFSCYCRFMMNLRSINAQFLGSFPLIQKRRRNYLFFLLTAGLAACMRQKAIVPGTTLVVVNLRSVR